MSKSQINPDEIFAEVAKECGYLSEEELQECRKIRDELGQMGLTVRPLAQIAVERNFITGEERKEIRQAMVQRGVYPRLGGYELIAKAGSGGMGTVYKARQMSLDRTVAIKVLAPEMARDESFVKRFQREAKLAGKLSHPNAVHVYDVGYEKGKYFIAMEFISGVTLEDVVAKGPLEEERALKIMRQVASALQEAHNRNIIHRDIKPGNIMLTRDGVAKLSDLGLAKDIASSTAISLTQTGIVSGTPDYMSPEQCRGEKDIDHRSDIYSLGITLFRFVTGEAPFQASTPMTVMTKHLEEPMPNPCLIRDSVSRGTAKLIDDMTAKDPERRIQSCEEIIERIDQILLSPSGSPSPEPTPTHRFSRSSSGKRFNLWFIFVPVLAALIIGAATLGILFGPDIFGTETENGEDRSPTASNSGNKDPGDKETSRSEKAANKAIRRAQELADEKKYNEAMHTLMAAWQEDQQNEKLIKAVMHARQKLKPLLIASNIKKPLEFKIRAYISGTRILSLRDGFMLWRTQEKVPKNNNKHAVYVNNQKWAITWQKHAGENYHTSNVFLMPRLCIPRKAMREQADIIDEQLPSGARVDVREIDGNTDIIFDSGGKTGHFEVTIRARAPRRMKRDGPVRRPPEKRDFEWEGDKKKGFKW
ncbi:MAG: serine/threonine protein kinase [Candidatus Brocadiia bacterium]